MLSPVIHKRPAHHFRFGTLLTCLTFTLRIFPYLSLFTLSVNNWHNPCFNSFGKITIVSLRTCQTPPKEIIPQQQVA